ncbi:alpha/beta fold hydrolase [Pseudomonas sp. PDM15]|uniref:alpha/beta fold hydrolase n=1 Tax=Pseudomonas sp. PDM15 TaxID=2769303 RepID=UPI001780397A|nr:alpha/beta fold hydrolase [Pseudomonas sp. PDM15]MBD9425065.1 alpha/beta fold hydrolase [Pseudomonas sp. PDM15]
MNKPHLLLLPGLLCDARLWQHQVAALADVAHVAVVDLSQADSMEELAQDALAQVQGQSFVLAGFSLGGYVALEIMRQAPQRVLALALLDTSAHADDSESKRARVKAMCQAEQDFSAFVASLPPRLLHPLHQQDAALVQVVTAMAESLGPEVFIRQQLAMLGRMDSRASLGQIVCPTLLLCGLEDAITPPALHVEMQSAIVGAQLAQIEEAGHLTPLEQPQRVSSNLESWLKALQHPLPGAVAG